MSEPNFENSSPVASGSGTSVSNEDRTWGMMAHLSPFLAVWLGGFSFLGPLVIMLMFTKSEFISDQAKEALNFQIAVTIAIYVSAVAIFCFVGVVLLPVVIIAAWVFQVIAGLAANKGVKYRYPYTIRFIQ